MKVIFLDIDGVLNSAAYNAKKNPNALSFIDETRLLLIKKIVDETKAKIVLSSSWRKDWDKNKKLCAEYGLYMDKVFGKYGMNIFDKTPELDFHASRRDEIALWLSNASEEIESLVIIDDRSYEWGELSDYFIKTDPYMGLGLEEEHALRAIEILNGGKKI